MSDILIREAGLYAEVIALSERAKAAIWPTYTPIHPQVLESTLADFAEQGFEVEFDAILPAAYRCVSASAARQFAA